MSIEKPNHKIKVNIIIFFGIILLLPILTFVLPKKNFSENENRMLEQCPTPTLNTMIDKSFMNDFTSFFSDHFFLRESWIALKNQMELAMNKKEINGVYLTKDRLIEHQAFSDSKLAEENMEAINAFAEKYQKPAFLMIAPTAESIYADSLPAFAPYMDQKKVIDSLYANTVKNLNCIDIFTPLLSAKNQYIYYNTDHHWTSLGAYYGYSASAKQMGFQHLTIDKFDVEHASHSFKGTLYSKTLYDHYKADVIDLYHLASKEPSVTVTVQEGKKVTNYNSIFFREFLTKKDQYATYLGQNSASVTIKTGIENGKKLLIFKDSYAHSMIQFYLNHYSEITMLDVRYLNNLSQYADINSFDQILFVYNFASIAGDSSIKKLGRF